MKRIVGILFLLTPLIAQETLDLDACIRRAIQYNPQLRISSRQQQAAQQDVRASYHLILPTLGVGTNMRRQTLGPSEYFEYGQTFITNEITSNYFTGGVEWRQNIYDGGQWWHNIRLAKSGYQASILDFQFQRQLLVVDVTEKFYSVLKACELLKVYQKALENSREQLKKTEELYSVRLVAQKDLFKAQVNEGNDRLAVIQQESALKTALAQLNFSMGQSPDQALTLAEGDYHAPEMIDPAEALNLAIQHNADYRQLQAQKQTAWLRYKMARGQRLPSVSSSFSYSRGSSKLERTFSEWNKWWNTSLNVSMSVPLFDGFVRRTAIQQRKLEFENSDDQISRKKLELQNQIDQLTLTLETYLKMIEINQLNIQSAREDLRLAQEMYRLNSATLLEILDAQVALTRAESNLITIKYDAKILEARLGLVTGQLERQYGTGQ